MADQLRPVRVALLGHSYIERLDEYQAQEPLSYIDFCRMSRMWVFARRGAFLDRSSDARSAYRLLNAVAELIPTSFMSTLVKMTCTEWAAVMSLESYVIS